MLHKNNCWKKQESSIIREKKESIFDDKIQIIFFFSLRQVSLIFSACCCSFLTVHTVAITKFLCPKFQFYVILFQKYFFFWIFSLEIRLKLFILKKLNFVTVCSVLCATRDNFLEKLLQLRSSFFQVEDDYGILSEQLVNSATTTAHLNFSREILSSWFNYLLKQKKAAISKINIGENLIYKNKKN